jgi:hypothetical protein
LSLKRGEEKYSVLCDGEGSGFAAGLGTGSGDARLEVLRLACPGLSLENMLVPEGAIATFLVALSRVFYAAARRGLATSLGW